MPEWLLPGPFPPEVYTAERCFITEQLNDPDCPEVSLALARVAPGVTTRLHAVRDTVERYVILRGEGRVEIDGAPAAVGPGDRVLIPAGAAQCITNTGAGDLEFACICTPRFRQEAYVGLD